MTYPVALVPGNGEIDIQTNNCHEQTTPVGDFSAAPAYTTAASADLWVYVPEYTTPNLTAKVTLIDNFRELGSWETALHADAGIMCVTLPQSLEANNTYAWEFEVLLTPDDSAANPKVGGLVTYTQQAEEYWYDALKAAIEQRQQAGSDEMLKSVLEPEGLGSLVTKPVVASCQ